MPGKVDPLAADLERALILKRLVGQRPGWVVVSLEQLAGVEVPNPHHILGEE